MPSAASKSKKKLPVKKTWWFDNKKASAKMTAALEAHERNVGLFETRDQFEKGMAWREEGKTGQEDIFRNNVWYAYLDNVKDLDRERLTEEYSLFELFDELPQYFLPDVEINDDYAAELACLGRMYMAVAGRNALDLLDPLEGESIADSGVTCAEKFKAHLERFRGENNFQDWTIELLQSTRPAILKALKDSRRKRGSASTSGPANGSSSRSAPRSQTANVTGGSNGRAEETPEPIIEHENSPQRTINSRHSHLQSDEVSEEVQYEVGCLTGLLGDITECAQIIFASKYLDAAHNEGPEGAKLEAFKVYTNSKDIDKQRLHWEIDFYQLTGETPSSMIDPGHGADNERVLLEDLALLAQRWISLSASGELGELEQSTLVKEAKRKGLSQGQILNAYLADYQRANGIAEWTKKNISDARDKVVKVWNEVHTRRREAERKRKASEGAEIPSAAKKAMISRRQSSATVSSRNGSINASSHNKALKPRHAGSPISDLYGSD